MKKLLTEADGRALAIKMLREAENLSLDATCLYPYDNSVRDGRPQNNYVLRYIKRLRKSDNEEAYRGFASLLSDFCVSARDGAPDADFYERDEKKAAACSDPACRRFVNDLLRATGA